MANSLILALVLLTMMLFKLAHPLEEKVISELVEDFGRDTGERQPTKHNIVRRDAGSRQSNSSADASVKPSSSISQHKAFVKPSTRTSTTRSQTESLPLAFSSISNTRITLLSPSTSSNVVKTVLPFLPTTSVISTGTPETVAPDTSTPPIPITEKTEQDDHKYYKSTYYGPRSGKKWWFGFSKNNSTVFHRALSKNIKFFDSLKSSFKFPYYGHMVDNVTIMNKGYLFLGPRLHKFHADAQYVAPLMADFGAQLSDQTTIRYIDTGNRFTVEWAHLRLMSEDQRNSRKEFNFQSSIFKNGTIVFAYKRVPIPVKNLKDDKFSVRVGLSDAFVRERVVRSRDNSHFIRFIIYYLYHKIKLKKDKVVDDSAIVLDPVPNCVTFNTCDSCLHTQTVFTCAWCPMLNRCSDGIDRNRQEWESAGCLRKSVTKCPAKASGSGLQAWEIVLIILVPGIILGLIGWIVYAYRHPQTKSGMFLIQYGNPKKWSRKAGSTQSTSTDGRISFKTMSFESQA